MGRVGTRSGNKEGGAPYSTVPTTNTCKYALRSRSSQPAYAWSSRKHQLSRPAPPPASRRSRAAAVTSSVRGHKRQQRLQTKEEEEEDDEPIMASLCYDVEWRNENRRGVPICPVVVRKQVGGTCGVHASVSCQETLNRIQLTRLSSNQVEVKRARTMVLSPYYVLRRMVDMAGGVDNVRFGARRALRFLETEGTILSQQYEYGHMIPSTSVCAGFQHFKLESWICLKGWDRFEQADKALEKGPIIGCFYVTEDLHTLKKGEVYTGRGKILFKRLPDGSEKPRRHAVCVTGFTGRGRSGLLNVLNSWGKKWQDSGFGLMKKWVMDRFYVPVVPVKLSDVDGNSTASKSEVKPLKSKKMDGSSKKEDGSSLQQSVEKVKLTSPKSASKSAGDEPHLGETRLTSTTKRKCTPGREKVSDAEDYGENVVGAKVKVWWPEDRQYYEGVIESFDPVKKKHKVVYVDGDEEILNLKWEKMQFIQDDSEPDEAEDSDCSRADTSSDVPLKKKMKTNSDRTKQGKTDDASLKKGGTSASKSRSVAPQSGQKSKSVGKTDGKSVVDMKAVKKTEEECGAKAKGQGSDVKSGRKRQRGA